MSLPAKPVVALGPKAGRDHLVSALQTIGVHFSDRLGVFDEKILAAFELQSDSVRELPENWPRHPMCESLFSEGRLIVASAAEHPRWGLSPCSIALPIYQRLLNEVATPAGNGFVEPPDDRAGGTALYPTRPPCILGISDPALISTPPEFGVWLRDVTDGIRFQSGGLPAILPLGYPGADISSLGFDEAELDRIADLWNAFGRGRRSERNVQPPTAVAPANGSCRRDSAEPDEALCERDNTSVPELVRRVYAWCRNPERDACLLDPLLREYDAWRAMLAPPKLPGTRIGFAWNARGRTESALQPFMPGGDWQSVQLTLVAPPETEVNGLMYCRPCRVWVRKFLLDGQTVPIHAGPGSVLSPTGELLRLDGAYEARQISFRTPKKTGPYLLNVEFFLESGPRIAAASIARSAENLHRCLAARAKARPSGGT